MRLTISTILAVFAVTAPASASRVLEYQGGGRLVPREVPYLPPPQGPEAVPPVVPAAPVPLEKRRARGPSVQTVIAGARRSHAITAAQARAYLRTYGHARSTRAHLHGRAKRELSSVIGVLEGIARRHKLTPSRMPALFFQLARNRAFWGGGASPGAGARITFRGSPLVFEYYAGQGLQIQPLANFGMANGLITHCDNHPKTCDRKGISDLLDGMVSLRSRRGSFTTWEYWFHFGGGTPPWTSGMSTATGIQALARASRKQILGKRSYLRVARSALGVFRRSPPVGVRARAKRGPDYLLYSFDPGQRVLNAFLQTIIGLYDYAQIAKDSSARALWKAGDREAQYELPRYDTGHWSRYSLGGPPASTEYHRLVVTFLDRLCTRIGGRYCKYYKRFKGYLHGH